MSDSDLEEAARRVASGDRLAFEDIVRATQAPLLRASMRILGSRAEGLDALQDAYLRAFDALAGGSFDERSRVSSWLYRVVVNASLDALRSRRRRALVPLASNDVEVDTGMSHAGSSEAYVALRELAKMLEQRLIRARATLRRRFDER